MTLLVIGLSHRSAPIDMLERTTLDQPRSRALRDRLAATQQVREAVVVTTCNRTEVYADVVTFHGGVTEIGQAIAEVTDVDALTLRDHLYVHHEDRAVSHTFSVACGLDSMAIGESQILGQLRSSLRQAQTGQEVGPELNALFQRALRVGKRAHTETEIDDVSLSLVSAGLDEAETVLGPLAGLSVMVVGAGAMSSLAVATVTRAGAREVVIANRTEAKARHLAEAYAARTVPWSHREEALAAADVVITCTGAAGRLVSREAAERTAVLRGRRPQVYLDLALPLDVDPAVAEVDGVTVVGLQRLGELMAADGLVPAQVQQVRDLVVEEVAGYLAARRVQAVAPTLAALRSRARSVVEAELQRFDTRTPDVDEATRRQVELTVHRVVEKILHTPTVRMKEMAGTDVSGSYAEALHRLFDLDPHTVAAVSAATVDPPVDLAEPTPVLEADPAAEGTDTTEPGLNEPGTPELASTGTPEPTSPEPNHPTDLALETTGARHA
ncbi:glutamyl-tRNA reductase [Arsenicicoccus sp. oral taxon 190]|uniref:glutamyl-tRNA reductase n=1 Tax=Arsenicicoccus sp. oral taxon 190 TaxID=1658671 RepID=UPI0009E64AFA|nr:glutamyl-tRNA reductase [Arsenicicoccus sp. oral taxon 190]